jgi:DnaJ-class molecular chaperone
LTQILIPRFVKNNETIELEELGHETLNTAKGKHGRLLVTVTVLEDTSRWREGFDIITRHYITLGNALKGSSIKVPTIHGTDEVIFFKPDFTDFLLKGKGIRDGA